MKAKLTHQLSCKAHVIATPEGYIDYDDQHTPKLGGAAIWQEHEVANCERCARNIPGARVVTVSICVVSGVRK